MGRKKLKLQFIENAKSRSQRFNKRKEALNKQLHELTTLCDVGACMIINDPTQNQTSIWPEQNPDHVRRLIDAARRNTAKSYGVSDFLGEKETIELRSQDECLNLMNESQLRELDSALRSKAEAIRSRIQLLKSKKTEEEEEEANQSINISNLDREIMPPTTPDLSHHAPPQPFFVYSATEGLYYFFPVVQNLPTSD